MNQQIQAKTLPAILYFQTTMKYTRDKKATAGFQDIQDRNVALAGNINIHHAAIEMQDE